MEIRSPHHTICYEKKCNIKMTLQDSRKIIRPPTHFRNCGTAIDYSRQSSRWRGESPINKNKNIVQAKQQLRANDLTSMKGAWLISSPEIVRFCTRGNSSEPVVNLQQLRLLKALSGFSNNAVFLGAM